SRCREDPINRNRSPTPQKIVSRASSNAMASAVLVCPTVSTDLSDDLKPQVVEVQEVLASFVDLGPSDVGPARPADPSSPAAAERGVKHPVDRPVDAQR